MIAREITLHGRCRFCGQDAKWSRGYHARNCPVLEIAGYLCPRCRGPKRAGFVFCKPCSRCPMHPSEDRFECPACESISEARSDERAFA